MCNIILIHFNQGGIFMSSKTRDKFVARMNLYGLSKHTQRGYITGVKGLAKHYNQSPETMSDNQVRAYFICDREVDDRYGLPPRPRGRKLPTVLSMEEVARLLACVKNLKHRVLLKTIYSGGLRVGEAVRLKPEHIESDPSRMVIRVEQGKGRKDRYTVLSDNLLLELREYWRKYSPGRWLFPGRNPDSHITTTSVSMALYGAKKKPA
jgi:integrase